MNDHGTVWLLDNNHLQQPPGPVSTNDERSFFTVMLLFDKRNGTRTA